jgi:hemerythrin-like domain-containing protein
LRQAQKATRRKRAQQLLLAAVAHSRQHFDREERIVFPMAEQVLKNQTLTELGRTWRQQRRRVTV